MHILMVHNYYQQRGGEDFSFEAETALLRERGHQVTVYTRHNDEISKLNRWTVASGTVWSRRSYRELRALMRADRPDLMHCTNLFPLISPAAYYAARRESVPVVQSLRNYRLLCPNAYLLREGSVCESCAGKLVALPGIRHACYRNSRAATAVVAAKQTTHRLLRTWSQRVNRYFTTSEFTRAKYAQYGFDAARISVKPNFLDPDPGVHHGGGGYALFVGRLSPEKGVSTLLDAWSRPAALPLRIAGSGPMADEVQRRSDGKSIRFLGSLEPHQVMEQLQAATCLVIPSVWHEPFGRVIIEAFACGTPVIASQVGAMGELVTDGQTGCLVPPGDSHALGRAVAQLAAAPAALRPAARRAFEARFTPQANYEILLEIYRQAIEHEQAGSPPTSPKPPADATQSDAELGDAELGDAELGDAELGDAELGDAELGDAPPDARAQPRSTSPRV